MTDSTIAVLEPNSQNPKYLQAYQGTNSAGTTVQAEGIVQVDQNNTPIGTLTNPVIVQTLIVPQSWQAQPINPITDWTSNGWTQGAW